MPHRPIILGVVGDSAAGKTTLTAGIAAILGPDRVSTICVDDYHRYNRAERRVMGMTALHPDCNNIDTMEHDLHRLAAGETILKPVYNHNIGDFDPPEAVTPRQFLIVEGLLGFATPSLRSCYHVKVYLNPPEELRYQWKLRRDCARRGYSPDQVLAELELRARDSREFIQPQRHWADMVVRFYPQPARADDQQLNVQLTLRPTLPHPDLSEVIGRTNTNLPVLRQRVGRDDGRLTEFLEVDGRVSNEQAADLEAAIWSYLPGFQHLRPEQLGTYVDGDQRRQSHPLALTQLLIAYHLLLARMEHEQAVV